MTTAPWCQETFIKAYRFAAMAHRNQVMPGVAQFPYSVHVSTVAMEVCAALTVERYSAPDLAVQCALLHDTIEDTAVTYEDLRATFGKHVASGVLALTKASSIPKPQAMDDSLERITKEPPEIWIVKLADRITNLNVPPEHWSVQKRFMYCDEAEKIRRVLGAASPYLDGRLRQKVDFYRENYCSK